MLRVLLFSFFFFNDTATTEIYTLSLHDALPISPTGAGSLESRATGRGGAPQGRRQPVNQSPGASRAPSVRTMLQRSQQTTSHHEPCGCGGARRVWGDPHPSPRARLLLPRYTSPRGRVSAPVAAGPVRCELLASCDNPEPANGAS